MTSDKATEIRVRMVRKHVTQTQIAKSLNPPVSQTAVYNVIEGKSESNRIKKAIAKAVGATVNELWPKDEKDDERAA